jgi:hypothetical protein
MQSNPIQLKYCKYCNEMKSRDLFPVNIMLNDHRESKCKKCRSEYDKMKRAKRNADRSISHF